MPTQLDVENQRFEFGVGWTVAFKYDDTDFHQKDATKLQGMIDGVPHSTKAVDVVGLRRRRGQRGDPAELMPFRGVSRAGLGGGVVRRIPARDAPETVCGEDATATSEILSRATPTKALDSQTEEA